MQAFIRRVLKGILRNDELTERVISWASSLPIAILLTTPVADTPHVWVRRPQLATGEDVCLFLTYAPDGRISEHSLFHARAWSACGFKVVLIVTTDDFDTAKAQSIPEFAQGVFVRLNRGYDFGGWAAAIQALPEIAGLQRLALANDSVYGPFNSFPALIDKVRQSPADMVGLTESLEIRRHFQSFILFFQNGALTNPAFHRFWGAVRNGGREFAVRQYEVHLVAMMERAGLSTMALFPAPAGMRRNPTMKAWRDLIERGFPFVKVRVLKEIPDIYAETGWASLLDQRGYDLNLVRRHLGGRG